MRAIYHRRHEYGPKGAIWKQGVRLSNLLLTNCVPGLCFIYIVSLARRFPFLARPTAAGVKKFIHHNISL